MHIGIKPLINAYWTLPMTWATFAKILRSATDIAKATSAVVASDLFSKKCKNQCEIWKGVSEQHWKEWTKDKEMEGR